MISNMIKIIIEIITKIIIKNYYYKNYENYY